MSDRAGPIGYILFAAFASAFVWVWAMVNHVPTP
jgi:hypothetical protein